MGTFSLLPFLPPRGTGNRARLFPNRFCISRGGWTPRPYSRVPGGTEPTALLCLVLLVCAETRGTSFLESPHPRLPLVFRLRSGTCAQATYASQLGTVPLCAPRLEISFPSAPCPRLTLQVLGPSKDEGTWLAEGPGSCVCSLGTPRSAGRSAEWGRAGKGLPRARWVLPVFPRSPSTVDGGRWNEELFPPRSDIYLPDPETQFTLEI